MHFPIFLKLNVQSIIFSKFLREIEAAATCFVTERGRRKSQQNSRIRVRAQIKLVYPVWNLSDSSKKLDDRQIKRFRRCRQSRFLFPDLSRKDRSDSASRVPHELTCQILTIQSLKIERTASPTCDHRKQRSSPPVFWKNWLNFLVRGQFKIKILIERGHGDINTTYFVWITGKNKLEPAIISNW